MTSPVKDVDGATHLVAIYGELDAQISPFTYVLTIPGDIFRSLEPAAKDYIASTFMNFVDESVMFCRDGTGEDRYFLGHPRHFFRNGGNIVHVSGSEPIWFVQQSWDPSTCVVLPATSAAKAKKLPRPANAYILYRKDRHQLVKRQRPGITNNQISQVLGAAWNNETREVRQQYREKAERTKAEFLKEHPEYQYKPRRSSEKKRRARRNPAVQPIPTPQVTDWDLEAFHEMQDQWLA